jgi:LytS/YehU family sensor histidine kinase
VLQQSSVAKIRLEDEVETLKLYIELEAMLLQSNFEYTLSVDENIGLLNIKIPGLIIQPFVENAFKHGLRHKAGLKKLELSFKLNNDKSALTISVVDNGIGRKASAKLNMVNSHEHNSFASEAIARRIKLLNYDKNDSVSVDIIDKMDQYNNSEGTMVILTIQIHE